MAFGDSDPKSGIVQYFGEGTPGSLTSVGEVVGGGWNIEGNITRDDAIGMRSANHSGIIEATVNVDLQLPTVAIQSGMIRSSATHSVGAKNLVFGGPSGEFLYTNSQPTGFTARCSVGEAQIVNAGFMALTPSQTATGDTQEASGATADRWETNNVTVDGTQYWCQSYEVSLDTGAYVISNMDNTSASRLPKAVRLGIQEVRLSLTLAKQIPVAGTSIFAGVFDEDIDVVITGASSTYTLSNLGSPNETGSFEAGSGLVLNTYEFPALLQLGALTVTASA